MPDQPTSGPAPRYHALDGLRVAAMLLGVAWHAEPWFDWRPVSLFMDWLHSFRMPLFLLISGFFGALMVAKYGARGYLARRWWRIGAPLLIGVFTFTPIQHRVGILADQAPAPGAAASPEVEFEASLVAQEWLETVEAARGLVDADGPGPGVPAGVPPVADSINRRIFGEPGGLFTLGHLWFLWYLLVFVTIAPPAARLAGRALRRAGSAGGRIPIGLAPVLLGLITFPCLMQMPGFGWGLGLATGIDGLFPDFLFQYQPDWPFYFAYFLAGWWLFRNRDRLPDVARTWLPALACGVAAYGASRLAYGRFSARTGLPGYAWIRLGGYGLSALATACTSWGMVGLFQTHFDRPTRAGRYFSELALWIYLVHQDLLGPISRGLRPLGLSSTGRGLIAAALTIALAAGLYEALIRPTPLARIFGPGRPRAGRGRGREVAPESSARFAANRARDGQPHGFAGGRPG